jgi:hypothetical protein
MKYKAMKLIGVGLAAGSLSVAAMAGNGAPSGAHYNLNILGMSKAKGKSSGDEYDQVTQGNGRRIFVNLDGNTKILLTEGDDFDVIDYDGTDGMATFQLPNPDPDCNGVTDYSVYVRGLGGGGSATIESCVEDKATKETYCSATDGTETLVSVKGPKGNGAAQFDNVSRQLLYVNIEGKRYPLFADNSYYYYWDYDNKGLRLAQMRFYEEIETIVGGTDPADCDEIVLPD